MDNSQAPSSILDTLRTVEFRLGLKGYNVDEVDEYLDKAAQEAEALQEHVRQLNERLRQASERIAQLERDKRAAPVAAESEESVAAAAAAAAAAAEANALSDETLQRTLLLAQKFVDQTKRESEAEAAAVIAQAEETARASIAVAEATAAQLQAETHQKLRDEVRGWRRPGPSWRPTSRAWPATSSRAQPAPGRAVRDPRVGGRERAAGELAHGCEAEGRRGAAARGGSGQAAGGGRRCADPQPGERIHLGSARARRNELKQQHPSLPRRAPASRVVTSPSPSRPFRVTRRR